MCEQCEELTEKVRQLETELYGYEWEPPREFRLTAMEGRILGVLVAAERARSKDFLIEATRDIPGVKTDAPYANVVQSKVCHLRTKLRPYGLEIENVFGRGYRLTTESRTRLLNWTAEHPKAA